MQVEREKIKESLRVVGTAFKDIEDACLKGYYKIEAQRLDETEEILRCIKLYSILKGIKKLTGKKMEVLCYYLKLGYSRQTKKDILKNLKITDSNLNNINHQLRKIGVIDSVGFKQSTNEVNKQLLEFKEFIVDKKGSYTILKLN